MQSVWRKSKEDCVPPSGGRVMRPTIANWFDKDVINRKNRKKELESVITLSNEGKTVTCMSNAEQTEGNSIRLLDEGAILYSDGDVRTWIAKGTLEKFYNALDDDYVGYITLGHLDLGSVPLVLGTWQKSDLSLVDLEDGRKGLEVVPHLDTELNIVKDLLRQELPLAVSVEVRFDFDYETSEMMGFLVAKDCFIQGFSIVGDPANTSSSNVKFKGEDKMKISDLLNSFSTDKADTDVLDSVTEEKEESEVNAQEEENKAVEDSNESENGTQSEEGEVAEDTDELSNEEMEKLEKLMESMSERIKSLSAENEELKKKLSSLNTDTKNKEDKIDDLLTRFENLLQENKPKQKTENLSSKGELHGFGVDNL